MADNTNEISFGELVDVRKSEMESILPGFQAEVNWKGKTAVVYSPDWYQKSKFRYNEK